MKHSREHTYTTYIPTKEEHAQYEIHNYNRKHVIGFPYLINQYNFINMTLFTVGNGVFVWRKYYNT